MAELNNVLNNVWSSICALRDTLGLAKGHKPSYDETINHAKSLDGDFYSNQIPLIERHSLPDSVRLYEQRGLANDVSPESLVEEDIKRVRNEISLNRGATDALMRELKSLNKVKSYFEFGEYMSKDENQILMHDFDVLDNDQELFRTGLGAPGVHKDFKFGDKLLRIRFAHPGKLERLIGSDLIYEVYDPVQKKIRFVHLQYKVWDGHTIYWSQVANLQPQLDRMTNCLCKRGYCYGDFKDYLGKNRSHFCCAFLRPTDALDSIYSPLQSSALHLQVCQVDKFVTNTAKINKTLKREKFEQYAYSGKSFDELFKKNFIGSKWLDIAEVDALYQGIVPNDHERILFHATEIVQDEL